MAIAKIVMERDTCIGAGPCVMTAASVFELDAEQKAIMKKSDGSTEPHEIMKADLADPEVSDDMLMASAQSCPVKAIKLYDEAGEQLYP